MKNNKINLLAYWTLKVFVQAYTTFKMERKTPKVLEVNSTVTEKKPLFDIRNSF